MDKRFDDYEENFYNEKDLILAVKDMEANSEWLPGIPRTSLTVLPLEAPMYVQEAVDKYKLDPDLAMDTVDDTRSGTHLLVKHQDTVWCLRDTGRNTLYTSAGQLGPANSNMVKAAAYPDLAQSMNLGLKHAKGTALLLIRYGKVVDAFLRLTGFKRIPETRMFRSKTHPHAMADIDAILQSPDNRLFVFEAKTTVAENYKAWSCGCIPRSYIPQMRQYSAVLNDDRICATYIGCIFTVDLIKGGIYIGSSFDYEQFVSRSLERDVAVEQQQLAELEDWWSRYVEGREEPPVSHIAKDDIEVFRKFHSGPADKEKPVLNLTPHLEKYQPVLDSYFKLMEDKASRQKAVDAVENELKSLQLVFMESMQDSTEARIDLPGGEYIELKWSPRGRTETDLERLAVAYPEAYAACVVRNPESSRVFTLKKKAVKAGKKK